MFFDLNVTKGVGHSIPWIGMLTMGSVLPARAAGGFTDMPWPMFLALNAFLLLPPFLVGLAVAKLSLAPMASLVAALWVIAWLWMAYEKGLAGAVERTTAFIQLMVFLSLPLVVGWIVGRFRHRFRPNPHPAAIHGK